MSLLRNGKKTRVAGTDQGGWVRVKGGSSKHPKLCPMRKQMMVPARKESIAWLLNTNQEGIFM